MLKINKQTLSDMFIIFVILHMRVKEAQLDVNPHMFMFFITGKHWWTEMEGKRNLFTFNFHLFELEAT